VKFLNLSFHIECKKHLTSTNLTVNVIEKIGKRMPTFYYTHQCRVGKNVTVNVIVW